MQTGDQSETIGFLADQAVDAGDMGRHETHISLIFLAGNRAWKLKKAVRLPYADFSTQTLRRAACDRELALNRVTAPGLYRRVRSITRGTDGGLEWDGVGPAVDHVVEMARFDQRDLFSAMAAEGRLPLSMMEGLATEIARFHEEAPRIDDPAGADRIAGVLSINEAGFATSHVLPPGEIQDLNDRFRRRLDDLAPALDARARAGRVRRCHGDLHLRNICLWQGRPCLFDCIEFNEELATTDTLYDLAFLLMDLWENGLHGHANLVANRYMDALDGAEDGGWPLLPFFMAIRAAVRAHVTATQAESSRGSGDFDGLAGRARRYFELAAQLLTLHPGRVIAIGGLSGSGKTTLAEALAPEILPAPGARLLETDRIRKAMFNAAPDQRLSPAAYAPEVSARVYDRLAQRTDVLAGQGASVMISAVLDRPDERAAIALAAGDSRFDGLWLSAPAEVLRRRIVGRTTRVSDADAAVLDRQLAAQPAVPDWRHIDVSGPLDETLAAARSALGLHPGGDG